MGIFLGLVASRYECGTIILTSNRGSAEWGEILGDAAIAAATLDRLLRHSHVMNIRGESYRLKAKRQSGILVSRGLIIPMAVPATEGRPRGRASGSGKSDRGRPARGAESDHIWRISV